MTNALTATKTPEEKESHAQAKAHEKAHAATQSRFYVIVEKWNSEKK